MADVFISYSRKDKDFVQRLDEALKKREREAWVDWEGIRPTEEFMQAIYAAIESADTFVFVLTPDSVASAVCKLEIAHATSHNKRLMPMVAREVNASEVPDAMAKLNWIFFRDIGTRMIPLAWTNSMPRPASRRSGTRWMATRCSRSQPSPAPRES